MPSLGKPQPSTENGETCPPAHDSTHGPIAETLATLKSKADRPENQTWGRFRIIRLLGQGGFSRVFLAEDPKLDRQVALKIPKPSVLFDEPSRIRFEREARAASILSHPAIIPVFDVGTENDVCYIVFGYCPGKSLAEWLSEQPNVLTTTAVAIVAELADAIQHAHGRGIIHRDLKPGNILINESADNAVDISKTIRITDFGLAKQIDTADHTLTLEGDVIGTPAYMSPEQARGDTDIGPASDVFSLGTIFYQLLTGETPFKKTSHLATLRAIENDPPISPQKLRPELPNDLRAVCLKCLNKEPGDRYASAYELQQDLLAWQQGLPVQARPSTRLEEFWKWCRRNPAIAAALTFAFLSLATGFSLTAWKWREAIHNRRLAETESARAQSNLHNLEDSVTNLQAVILDVQSIPNTSPLRSRILSQIIEIQELLIAQEQDSPRARLLAFDGYQCLARAKRALGDNEGADQAVGFANRQLAQLQQLDEFDLFTKELELKQIDQMCLEAETLSNNRDYAAVKNIAEKALARLSDPDSLIEPVKRACFAASFLQLKGNAHERLNEFSEAEAAYSQCLNEIDDVQEKLTPRHWLFTCAACFNSLGILNKRKDKVDEAKLKYFQAIEIAEQLMEENYGYHNYRGLFATISFNLANLEFDSGEYPSAMQHYRQSINEFQQLEIDFPDDRSYLSTIFSAKSMIATIQGKLGNHVEAAETLQQLIGTASEWPDSFNKDVIILKANNNLGRLKYLNLNQIADAEIIFRDVIKLADQALAGHGYNSELLTTRGIACLNLSDVYFCMQQLENAEKFAMAAEANYLQLIESSPSDNKTQSGLADVYQVRGKIFAARGEFVEAEKQFAQIPKIDPTSPRLLYELARGYATAYSEFASSSTNNPLSNEQLASFRDSAIRHVRTAFAHGFNDLDSLMHDDAWAGFVNQREYQDLLSELSERKLD